MSMMRAFGAVIIREIKSSYNGGGGAFLPTAFFMGAILLLPFSVGPDPETLRKIGPGYLWLALSLASLVSLERLFQGDLDDGSFEQFFISPNNLGLLMLAKLIGSWIAISVPIALAAPICALMINIEGGFVLQIALQMFVGSLGMFLLGAIGAALSASIKRGGLLIALLALPLYAPIVIFGAASAGQIIMGREFANQGFLLICAIDLFALILCPIAIAAAMKLHVD